MSIMRLALLGTLVAAAPLLATGSAATDHSGRGQPARKHAASAALVQLDREATRPFAGVNAAVATSTAVGSGDMCDDAHWPAPETRIVRVHLLDHAGLARYTRRELMNEASRIWRTRGVTVHWSDDPKASDAIADVSPGTDGPEIDIYVTLDGDLPARRPGSQRRPLAAIEFTGDVPTTRITAFPREAERLMEGARANDRPLTELPSEMRYQFLGRMLGRAVGHELGHYLFKSRDHADGGLMRATQRTDELIAPFEGPFRVVPPRVPAAQSQDGECRKYGIVPDARRPAGS
jgi:hypothetical protein